MGGLAEILNSLAQGASGIPANVAMQAFALGVGSMVPFVAIKLAMVFFRRGAGDVMD